MRIGNAAHGQVQLDAYGEVIDALHHAKRTGIDGMERTWALQCALLDHLEAVWKQPDAGIWEVRGEPRQFTYTKVMAWVAFDRAVRNVEAYGHEGPVERWRVIRDDIHKNVCENGFDQEMGTFVQSYGSKQLDASLLLLPAVGFLPPEDPRIRATVEAIEGRLLVGGFVMRYDAAAASDGLPPGEGAFLACSFWLVNAYVMLERIEDAQCLFTRLLSLRNDVGLLSEEYDAKSKRQVGNFPQAFSHIALINSAHNLSRAVKSRSKKTDWTRVFGTQGRPDRAR